MKALTEKEINERLKEFDGWDYGDNAIHTSLEFETFKDAFSIMTRIAFEAEKQNHHPEWLDVKHDRCDRNAGNRNGGEEEAPVNHYQHAGNHCDADAPAAQPQLLPATRRTTPQQQCQRTKDTAKPDRYQRGLSRFFDKVLGIVIIDDAMFDESFCP